MSIMHVPTDRRSNRKRLLVALSCSSIAVLLLLNAAGDRLLRTFEVTTSRDTQLNVDVNLVAARDRMVSPQPAETMPESSRQLDDHSAAGSSASPPPDGPTPATPARPTGQPEVDRAERDWYDAGSKAAREIVAREFARQDADDANWRRTGSVMFERRRQPAVHESQLMADLAFVRRSRVLGIGLNIGGCFFGIPLAGVPVEQRTAGPSLIVCPVSGRN